MSSLCPPVGVTSLASFTNHALVVQSEFGALCGVCLYDVEGRFLIRFDNFEAPGDDLFAVLRRAVLDLADYTHPTAYYVGLFATDQRDPSNGYVSAELTLGLLDELLHPAGLQLLHRVETWKEEIRIPDALVTRHWEAAA